MRTFPFIFIPLHHFYSPFPLLYEDSHPDSTHFHHSHPNSPHSHPDSMHSHHSPHSIPNSPFRLFQITVAYGSLMLLDILGFPSGSLK